MKSGAECGLDTRPHIRWHQLRKWVTLGAYHQRPHATALPLISAAGSAHASGTTDADRAVRCSPNGPKVMRWMAPAPPASNLPKCSCRRLQGKEPPNDSKDRGPGFGQGCFSSTLRFRHGTPDHQQEDQARKTADIL